MRNSSVAKWKLDRDRAKRLDTSPAASVGTGRSCTLPIQPVKPGGPVADIESLGAAWRPCILI